jgi:hypothetical protein
MDLLCTWDLETGTGVVKMESRNKERAKASVKATRAGVEMLQWATLLMDKCVYHGETFCSLQTTFC